MTHEQFYSTTDEQQAAMRDLFSRARKSDWVQFIRDAYAPTALTPYIGVPDFAGMFIGIERDGYTHS